LLKRYYQKGIIEAGTDEAGRGCLAGPVVAAAVILRKNYKSKILNDSKQLSESVRDELRLEIEAKAITYGVAFVYPEKIDEINILNASIYAMHLALEKLNQQPELILVDGNRFKPFQNIKHQCVIKGDAIYLSIAAASILAKTYRDDYMKKLHVDFPQYGWNENKGYPTVAHRKAIAEFGSNIYHRKSFRLLPEPEQMSLF
jgi:ribonuclease HII